MVAPDLARGSLTSASQIELIWTPPTASYDFGGSAITGFKIYSDDGDGDIDTSTFELFHDITDPTQVSFVTTDVS